MITFTCPECGKAYTVDARYAGGSTNCQSCQATMMVPESAIRNQPSSAWRQVASSQTATALIAEPAKEAPRTRRLRTETSQIQETFRHFPLIIVHPLHGDPPELYRVEYHVRGLARGAGGQPILRDQHLVEIQLTRDYPRQCPKCKMLTPIFHPNVDPTTICVGDHWHAGQKLTDLIVRIGEMITFQAYNIKSPLDGEAAMWADQNQATLPIDRRDLHPAEK